jgi:hypothetical protein
LNTLNNLRMEVELFAPQRLGWVHKLDRTSDKQDMN